VHYQVYAAAKDGAGNRKRIDEHWASAASFPVPAGRYYVTAESDAGKGELEVAVSVGEMKQVQIRISPQR
jgi:hypothetical protein